MSDETFPKIPESLMKELQLAEVDKFTLNFSGGSDEGFLNIEIEPTPRNHRIQEDIENWAWDVFGYSGAGDGIDYGDDYVYDLKRKIVTHSAWFMERQESDSEVEPLVVGD